MSYSLSFIKQAIEDYVSANLDSIELTYGNPSNKIVVNKSIFDIENYLLELRQQYNIHGRLDGDILSSKILKSFNNFSNDQAFRTCDYQLNFLHFLGRYHEPNKPLYKLVDEFVDLYKNQFTLADIVKTKTGATRCKTNIRMCLIELRDVGLVLNYDEYKRRSWGPSIIGLVVLLNILHNKHEFSTFANYKTFDSLLTRERIRLDTKYDFDPTLFNSVQMFNDPEHLYGFLNQVQLEISKEEKPHLEKIISSYIDFVQEGLKITPNGIKTTKLFAQKSIQFQEELLTTNLHNRTFYIKLLEHYRKVFGA